MLVYFGYTHCPDACPTALQDMANALDLLGAQKKDVAVVFVTIDPERDTPGVMKDYVAAFEAPIAALTGTAEQVAAAARAYRVYYRKHPEKDGGYSMDHSSIIYVMDKQGAFRGQLHPRDAARDHRNPIEGIDVIRPALLMLVMTAPAWAGSVSVRNGTGETMTGVQMAPAGSGQAGDNRLRSTLPPGAEGRFTYSTGCRADVRLAFAGGRTEDHRDVDVCGEARIVAGVAGVAGPAVAAAGAARLVRCLRRLVRCLRRLGRRRCRPWLGRRRRGRASTGVRGRLRRSRRRFP